MRYLFILVMLISSIANAQNSNLRVFPEDDNFAGIVMADSPGKWIVFAEGFMPIVPTTMDGGASILVQGKAGVYGVAYLPSGDAQPFTCRLVLGVTPPNPPVPPKPKPTPGGPYQIMMFYNDLSQMPQEQRVLLNSLALRKSLVDLGHSVLEIVEAKDLTGRVLPADRQPFIDAVKADPLPRIAIAPKEGGKVLDFPLPASEVELFDFLKRPDIAAYYALEKEAKK